MATKLKSSLFQKPLLLLCAVMAASTFTTNAEAQGGPPIGPVLHVPIPPVTPARFVPGAPTIIVSPGRVKILATGQVFTHDNSCGSGPIENAVAYALRLAQPGDVLGIEGQHPKVQIQPFTSVCNSNSAGWAGAVMTDVTLIGLNASATIDSIFIKGDYTQAGDGGVDGLTLQNLTLRNTEGGNSALHNDQLSRQGLIRVYDCAFVASDPSAHGGYGMKFGMRFYLVDSLDARGNFLPNGAKEHFIYADSLGFNGGYPTAFILKNNAQGAPTGRTGFQLVNRIYPASAEYPNYMGSPGGGLGICEGNVFSVNASIDGGGGSAFTFGGHFGDIWVRGNHVTFMGTASGGGGQNSGGLTAWTPTGNHPTWIHPSGYSLLGLYVVNNIFTSSAINPGTRACVSVTGSEFSWIGLNLFQGADEAVILDSLSGGPIYNGKVILPLSSMVGWQQGGTKVKVQDLTTGQYVNLTDAQIDSSKYK